MSKIGLYLIGVGIFAAAALGLWAYVKHLQSDLAHAKQAEAVAKAEAIQEKAHAASAQAATAVVDAGGRRDALTITVHGENAHALSAAPGADAPVAPSLNRVGRLGMCRYEAARDDPGCVQLRGPGPGQLPPPGQEHAPPF